MGSVPETRCGAVAAAFGRDLDLDLLRVETIVRHARQAGVTLLVLPAATLGGHPHGARPLTPMPLDDPAVRRVCRLAGDVTVCLGLCEADGSGCFCSAVVVTGDGVLGVQRQVHVRPPDTGTYAAGDRLRAIDSPVGRLGLLVDDDKSFPEAARALALDGAEVLACPAAWPAGPDARQRGSGDPESRSFDLYDRVRATENQVVVVSSNLTGRIGPTRFLGQAKVVGPAGDVLARTWGRAGLATAAVDVSGARVDARRGDDRLVRRRPEAYRSVQRSNAG